MSKENVQAFMAKLQSDETLKESYLAMLKSVSAEKVGEAEALQKGVQFAAEHGFEISMEDIKSVASSSEESALTDQELESVAGGSFLCVGIVANVTDDDEGGVNVDVCVLFGVA